MVAGVGVGLAPSACGGGQNQAASEPSGNFAVTVSTARFPASQRLAQHTHLVIAVHNAGSKTIPNVAVTICNVTCAYPAPKGEGSSSQAFAAGHRPELPGQPVTAAVGHRPRAGRVRLQLPERRAGRGGHGVCQHLGAGTAGPGQDRALRLGGHRSAGRQARPRLAGGGRAQRQGQGRALQRLGAQGPFAVNVGTAPAQSYVNNNGQIVTKQ